MQIHLLAALDEAFGIGWQGRLPWHLPDDLKRFKTLTMGHCIVMGRKTWQSLGRALPGRTSLVLSRSALPLPQGVVCFADFAKARDWAQQRGESNLFVIGGGEIYAHSLEFAHQLDLTRVHARLPADVYFPRFDVADWQCVAQELHPADDRHPFAFTFETWVRAAIRVRLVSAESAARDLEALARLNREFNEVRTSAAQLRQRLAAPNCVEYPFIAEMDDEIVGFGALRMVAQVFYAGLHAELTEFYVAAPYRRRGVGRALLKFAEQLARTHGADEIVLLTGGENTGAQAFYAAAGYEPWDDVLMGKELG
ncbi:MAG: hypothetical protein OHK0052_15740 [Anaerolineales bacterium]